MKYKLRPINQQKCYEKALDKDIFLIAAKCRFGKTFVASKIVCDGWSAKNYSKKILVISGFSSIEGEWRDTIKDQFPECEDLFEFKTIQYLNIGKEHDEIIKNFQNCYLVFDEAHFGERTENTQEIIKELNPSKRLYLTATPYTDSLMKKFKNIIGADDSNTFSYSIQDEFEDYFKDPEGFVKENGYTPVEMKLNILESDEIYENEDGEVYWTSEAVKLFKKELDRKSYKTFMYFTKDKAEATNVKKIFKNHFPELTTICQLSGDEDDQEEVESAKKKILEAKAQEKYAMVIACKRGGTGVTWKGLDCVCFYDAPNSAIDFIQKSYRCATPNKDKTSATIYCFNKISALKIYYKVNKLEAIKKGISEKENFEKFQKYFKLEGDFTELNFNILLAELCKKVDYTFADFDGIDIFDWNDKSSSKEGKDSKKTSNKEKDGNGNSTNVKEEQNKKINKSEEKEDRKEEFAKKNFWEKFSQLKKVLKFYKENYQSKDWDFDFTKPETYNEMVWLKIEQSFSKDQWIRFLENNNSLFKVIESKENEKVSNQKETVEKVIIKNTNSDDKKKELMKKYPDAVTKTVKEVSTRNTGLQADLKKENMNKYGICFGVHTEYAEYAHITPFCDVKCTEDVYDFNNGICIPHSLHHCWDSKVVELVPDEEGYLKVVVVKDTDDTSAWVGRKSNYKLSKEQLYFFNKRKNL